MELTKIFKKISHRIFEDPINQEQMKAGTGFMICLSDMIRELEKKGYSENLVPEYDHFRFNQTHLYPQDFYVDDVIRFENSSDPDDQAILYAIRSDKHHIKGLYVESYGLYHDSLSNSMLERIKFCQKEHLCLQQQ